MIVNGLLLDKTTRQIVNRTTINTDTANNNLDPNYLWMIERYTNTPPSYDSRIYILDTNLPDLTVDLATIPDHPDHAGYKEYLVEYALTKRVNSEIEGAVYNAEKLANNGLLGDDALNKLAILGIGVLFRALDGLTLTTKEETLATKLQQIAIKIWQNDQNLRDKLTEIASNIEPDIDAGWEQS